jgi:elongator complex protein 3
MLEFGATRVELGVQTLSDDIYRLVKRGHLVEDVVKANALLRNHGFKVYYHWMPGLPGATPEMDLELSGKLFDDENHRPDGLKIYPTMVVEDTGLEKWWLEGRYQPYSNNTMIDLTIGIKTLVPKYVRISRVLRDIPSKFIVAGLKDSLRDIARERMKRDSLECRCIRCREYGHRANAGWAIGEPQLVRMDYDVCGGKEIFLSFEDEKETLFGLLRLRIPPRTVPVLQNGRNDAIALVRELHVFGPQVPLSEQREDAAQHKGLGRALLLKAEDIALNEFHVDRMIILSGVGAREYYRNDFGYSLVGDYMVKNLQNRD